MRMCMHMCLYMWMVVLCGAIFNMVEKTGYIHKATVNHGGIHCSQRLEVRVKSFLVSFFFFFFCVLLLLFLFFFFLYSYAFVFFNLADSRRNNYFRQCIRIPMNKMEDAELMELVSNTLHVKAVPDSLRAFVIEKSLGSPVLCSLTIHFTICEKGGRHFLVQEQQSLFRDCTLKCVDCFCFCFVFKYLS